MPYPVTVPTTFANFIQDADADEVNANFQAILDAINGGLTYQHLAAAAALRLTQVAVGANGLAMGVFVATEGGTSYAGGGAQTLVNFNAETLDVSGWFDTANKRFVPQKAGIYRLTFRCKIETATDQAYYNAKIRKNGSEAASNPTRASGTSDGLLVTALLQANGTTDYFDVLFENGGGASTISAAIFEGELIGLT